MNLLPASPEKQKPVLAKPVASRLIESADDLQNWIEGTNPLRGLSLRQAQDIYDMARRGNTVRLQWIYQEIEKTDPTLMICAEKRGAALVELDWCIRQRPQNRTRAFDPGLAADQAALLEAEFGDAEQTALLPAIEHLSLAFFRGFAHALPLFGQGDRNLQGFEPLDTWNFCRDMNTGTWFWTPKAAETGLADLQPIAPGALVTVDRARAIDYPALAIYLRAALGEKRWGQVLERYGIPPVIITMPPDIDPASKDEYMRCAAKVAEGASGALPSGSTVSYATEARGANPFTPFLDHQQQLVVLLATGGILTSLNQATGIGGGATDAHEAAWRTIVRRDAGIIATALNRTVSARLLAAHFPNRPQFAYFDFRTEPQLSPAQVFEIAGAARTAGYIIDQAQLEEQSGYTLKPAPEPAAPGVTPALQPTAAAPDSGGALNGAQIASIVSVVKEAAAGAIPTDAVLPTLQTAFPTVAPDKLAQIVKSLEGFRPAVTDYNEPAPAVEQPHAANRRRSALRPPCKTTKPPCKIAANKETPNETSEDGSALKRVLEAFSADAAPVAAEVEKLLALPPEEQPAAAEALLKKLPGLIPADPELAAILAEEMATAFAEEFEGGAVANRAERCPECEQWLDTNGTCTNCRGTAEENGVNPDSTKMQAAEIGKGKTALAQSLTEKRDIHDAVVRSDIGAISFIYGQPGDPANAYKGGFGISHIEAKHGKEGILEKLPEVLIRGKVEPGARGGNKKDITLGEYKATLTRPLKEKGKAEQPDTWIITAFKVFPEKKKEAVK